MADNEEIFDVSTCGDPNLEAAFRHFCRHLVSLICRMDEVDKEGNLSGRPEFFGFSGTILSFRSIWSLLTAGHILQGIEDRLSTGRFKFQFFLADTFGPEVTCNLPIPFEYESEPKAYVNEKEAGLDFGAVRIRPYYRALWKSIT